MSRWKTELCDPCSDPKAAPMEPATVGAHCIFSARTASQAKASRAARLEFTALGLALSLLQSV